MSIKSLLLVAGTGLSFLTASHAAVVSVHSYSFPGTYEIVTNNEFSDDNDRVYYELINTGGTTTATVSILDTNPENRDVRYVIYNDGDSIAGQVTTGSTSPIIDTVISENDVPAFFTFLMAAGGQYILELSRTGNGLGGVTTEVSTVPLPGAIWLFASALLGFLGISSRRKSAA